MMFERKMTLAVALALAVQGAGVFLWAGRASQRLADVETRVAPQAELAERLARVEVRQQLAAEQLDRIEKRLEGGR